MKRNHGRRIAGTLLLSAALLSSLPLSAQQPSVLAADDLAKLVPPSFYFEGQLGPTQMRNSAGVSTGAKRHFIAALVDTSGYASNIRGKYEGFFISDDAVVIGGTELKSGAYGFGVTDGQKFSVFDVGGKLLFSVAAARDDKLQSPRPLMITQTGKELRLYRGKSFVVIGLK